MKLGYLGELNIDRIMALVVVVIVGLAMAPVVDRFTDDYKDGPTTWENDDNHDEGKSKDDDVTGARATLADLIPLFYIIGIVLASIGMALGSRKE